MFQLQSAKIYQLSVRTSLKISAGLVFILVPSQFVSAQSQVPIVTECTVDQTRPAPVPPEKFALSPGNVDMRTGQLVYQVVDLNIGGEDGLTLERSFRSTDSTIPGSFGNMLSSWEIYFFEDRVPVCFAKSITEYDYQVTVQFGQLGSSFRSPDDPGPTDFKKQNRPSDATLTFDYVSGTGSRIPVRYYYTAADGTKVTSELLDSSFGRDFARVEKIVKPNGTKIELLYNTTGTNADPKSLRAVKSNRGYALLYEYKNVGPNSVGQVAKICAVNLVYHTMPSTSVQFICPTTPISATYEYDSLGQLKWVENSLGERTLIGPRGTLLYHQGSNTPYVTNVIEFDLVTKQTFADGQVIDYSWFKDSNPDRNVMGGIYTQNGSSVEVRYAESRSSVGPPQDPTWYVTPGPVSIKDEMGRTSSYVYCENETNSNCDYVGLKKASDPKGIQRRFMYDGNGNVIKTQTTAADSGAVLESSAEYLCLEEVCQHKPTSVTDANGNRTDFTYSPVHGGVLTETGPAVNGVRPQKRYTYTQRNAWIKGAGSSFVQVPDAIWLLDKESSCNNSAATGSVASPCAAGLADEVRVSYVYEQGSSTKGSNLLLLGTGVTAADETGQIVTRWTCYSYDNFGRKFSETGPSANLTGCQ